MFQRTLSSYVAHSLVINTGKAEPTTITIKHSTTESRSLPPALPGSVHFYHKSISS